MEGAAAPQPMRVDARLVREQLVAAILQQALPRAAALAEPVTERLHEGVCRLADADDPLQDAAASLGYACRELEVEMFEPARRRSEWLEDLRGGDPLELAVELARSEPEQRPDPGQAPSWRVPGPGGHVRHYLALDGAAQLIASTTFPRPGSDAPARLKPCWMLGFFLRCTDEAEGGPATPAQHARDELDP